MDMPVELPLLLQSMTALTVVDLLQRQLLSGNLGPRKTGPFLVVVVAIMRSSTNASPDSLSWTMYLVYRVW